MHPLQQRMNHGQGRPNLNHRDYNDVSLTSHVRAAKTPYFHRNDAARLNLSPALSYMKQLYLTRIPY
jgi:hypothetical protein